MSAPSTTSDSSGLAKPGASPRAPAHSKWFADEVYPHDTQLKSYLRTAFPSVRDLEDVVQESYLRVWRRQLANPIRSAKSFLFKVARNLALDSIRHRYRHPSEPIADLVEFSVLDCGPTPSDATISSEELDLLAEAIDSLPPRCREVVILRKLIGLSQKEIAARLQITERTVEVQGTKGLDRCEMYLRARGLFR